MTLEELSGYLKVSRAYLYKEVQRGRIPAVKVGRSWRFSRDKIDQWLEEKHQPKAEKIVPDEFPWSDCLEVFLQNLRKKFGKRFSSLWIYGSWARGEAREDSDVDLLIVLDNMENFWREFHQISDLAYEATFGRGRCVLFSTTLCDQETFIKGMEPLLINVKKEGKKAA